jgi:acetyl esterase/lipase
MTPFDLLHPDIAKTVGAPALPPMTDELVATIRSIDMSAPVVSDAVECIDLLVPGDPALPMRVFRPRGIASTLPCLYSMHGGGYVIGTYDMDNALFEAWCPKLNIIGVTVDYRLAPDTPYPGPLEDCYRGLRWCIDHADDFGIDGRRVGVNGLSAGGGLAAALALVARDRGLPLAFQLLDSPMLDDRQTTQSSQIDDLPVWSRESNEYGWRSYLGDLYGTDAVPYTAAPARAEDLSGLPPAFVSVGAVDGFLDESVDYAMRLNHAGVPTELHVYPGACHGYQLADQCEVTRQSRRDQEDWITRQLRIG